MQADEYVVHPLRVARVERGLTQEELAQEIGLGVSTIRRAEKWFPLNIKTQRILSNYFEKTPKELGLLGRCWTQGDGQVTSPVSNVFNPSTHMQVVDAPAPLLHKAALSPQFTPIQAIDLLAAQPCATVRGRLVIRKHPELLARSDAGRAGHTRHDKTQTPTTERRGNGERH